jgi:hypothetical protein
MTTVSGPILCLGCEHLRTSPYQAPWTCDAYPDNPGIPVEIKYSGFDHRQPFEGDNGIQFEQRKGLEDLTLNYDDFKKRLPNAG